MFDKVALIGLGLIGSSLGRALRGNGLAARIAGAARTEATCETALRIGFVDEAGTDPAAAVADADLVVIGTPVGTYATVADIIAPALKPGAIVTDVGSVKQAAVRDLAGRLPDGVHLVPGHPVAGTEHSGPESGFAELFRDYWCILTPPPGTDEAAVERVAAMWRACGMIVEVMDAEHHDTVLAVTSHLPHLIAYAIVGTATDLEDSMRREVLKFAASGFREFTRIAASNPVMWRDIFLNNKEAVLEVLGRFSEDLTALQRAVRRGEGEVLHDLFTRTRDIRRGVIEAGRPGQFNPRKSAE